MSSEQFPAPQCLQYFITLQISDGRQSRRLILPVRKSESDMRDADRPQDYISHQFTCQHCNHYNQDGVSKLCAQGRSKVRLR